MMSRLSLLMVITFIESFSTILVERGVYFFADKQLSFTPQLNLWLGCSSASVTRSVRCSVIDWSCDGARRRC